MDSTYIPMARGFIVSGCAGLVHRGRVLAWRVSITLEADFCMEAVEEALAKHGTPEIVNTPSHAVLRNTLPGNGSGQPVHLDRLHQGVGCPRGQNQHASQHASRCLLANSCR